jgi:hypothetical protein
VALVIPETGGGARVFWGSTRDFPAPPHLGGARVFWGSTRNFPAPLADRNACPDRCDSFLSAPSSKLPHEPFRGGCCSGHSTRRLRTQLTVEAILAQDPHGKPASTDHSPAPFVHASDDSTEMEFRAAYRAFVDAFRAGALRLRERAREIRDMFPLCAFPPQLPFKEAA